MKNMISIRKRALAAACLLTLSSPFLRAAPPTPEQVAVSVQATPADAFTSSVQVGDGPSGSHTLEVAITNHTSDPAVLHGVTVRFPWIQLGADALLSSGDTCMGRTPAQVFTPQAGFAIPHLKPDGKPLSGTYLLAKSGGRSFLTSFVTWKTFVSKMTYADGGVTVAADGEDIAVPPGQTLSLEKVWLAEDADWQDLLFAYADEIARENDIHLRQRPTFVGWSTWDYYGGGFTADAVRDNLKALVGLGVGANFHQLDGGWWAARGDYLKSRADLPGGPKALAAAIHEAGLTAGIHLDGMRGDPQSEVFRDHPDFFLHDQDGKPLHQPIHKPGNDTDYLFFDYSNPEARAYMRDALRTIHADWGYDYFKIDFLRFGLNEYILQATAKAAPGRKVVAHDPSLTSLQRLRLGLAAFREGIGPDSYLLACSSVFGPVFGQADALRTGGDISPNFDRFRRACMENDGNFFLHRKVIDIDADSILVRSKEDEEADRTPNPDKSGGDLKLNEVEMWATYVGLFGGPKIDSDKIPSLRPERRDLLRRAIALPTCTRFVPLDFWEHARTPGDDPSQIFLGEAQGKPYLALFNWSDAPRTYRLEGWKAEAAVPVLLSGAATVHAEAGFTAQLEPRHVAVFRIEGDQAFDTLRKTLTFHEN
jgi:alpha-galactosidase